ncbi:MAG: hypothetical protein ACTHOR_16030 [Devosia sp.]|jgi:hypothetical protein|nr:hypothetical protein [Devosiaceae bacterium]
MRQFLIAGAVALALSGFAPAAAEAASYHAGYHTSPAPGVSVTIQTGHHSNWWWRHHHRPHKVKVCHTFWRHHHKVRVCEWKWRRW